MRAFTKRKNTEAFDPIEISSSVAKIVPKINTKKKKKKAEEKIDFEFLRTKEEEKQDAYFEEIVSLSSGNVFNRHGRQGRYGREEFERNQEEGEKYGGCLSSLLFSSKTPRTLRFLGNVHKNHIHWLNADEVQNFMRENFNVEIFPRRGTSHAANMGSKPRSSYDVNSPYIKYICTSKEFPTSRVFTKQFSEISGWNNVSSGYQSRNRVYSLSSSRVFCMGCAMGKKKIERYTLPVINTETDTACLFEMPFSMGMEIKRVFMKYKTQGYESLDQWLYDYDLTISQTVQPGSKDYEFNVEPHVSKYTNLRGQIYIPNPNYVFGEQAVLNSIRLHAYESSSGLGRKSAKHKYRELRDSHSKAISCNVDTNGSKVDFTHVGSDEPYYTFRLLEDQGFERTSLCRGDLLEI